jgi:hypothetical protein
MIFSLRNKLLFIKGRKVGGTSLEMALSSICGDEDIITPITPVDERERYELTGRMAQNFGIESERYLAFVETIQDSSAGKWLTAKTPAGKYYNHMPLREIVRSLGAIPDDFRIICVERSPYYKVMSLANWTSNSATYRGTGAIANVEVDGIRAEIDQLLDSDQIRKVYNRNLYIDTNDRVRPEILKFENLACEYQRLMRELGTAQPVPLPHAKKGLESERFDVAACLRRDQIEKINRIFDREFEDFGYATFAP